MIWPLYLDKYDTFNLQNPSQVNVSVRAGVVILVALPIAKLEHDKEFLDNKMAYNIAKLRLENHKHQLKNKMRLEKVTKVFSEEVDCGADTGTPAYNSITIETVSNGVGNYIVLKTDRWALDADNIQELTNIIKAMSDEVN